MTAITMKSFMTALTTGTLVINTKSETGETAKVSKPIFDETGALIPEMVEYAQAQITKIDEKNFKRKATSKPTAKQLANEARQVQILQMMTPGVVYTAKDICAFGFEDVTTSQKVAALMKSPIAEGTVMVTDVKPEGSKSKVKGYSLVETETETETETE